MNHAGRDRAAGPPGPAARGGHHHHRAGAYRPAGQPRGDRRGEGGISRGLQPGGVAVLPRDSAAARPAAATRRGRAPAVLTFGERSGGRGPPAGGWQRATAAPASPSGRSAAGSRFACRRPGGTMALNAAGGAGRRRGAGARPAARSRRRWRASRPAPAAARARGIRGRRRRGAAAGRKLQRQPAVDAGGAGRPGGSSRARGASPCWATCWSSATTARRCMPGSRRTRPRAPTWSSACGPLMAAGCTPPLPAARRGAMRRTARRWRRSSPPRCGRATRCWSRAPRQPHGGGACGALEPDVGPRHDPQPASRRLPSTSSCSTCSATLTFRAGAACLTALVLSLLLGPAVIRWLRGIQRGGQPIREDGPERHLVEKKGTPTMGGVLILLALTVSTLLWADLRNGFVWAVLLRDARLRRARLRRRLAEADEAQHEGRLGARQAGRPGRARRWSARSGSSL